MVRFHPPLFRVLGKGLIRSKSIPWLRMMDPATEREIYQFMGRTTEAIEGIQKDIGEIKDNGFRNWREHGEIFSCIGKLKMKVGEIAGTVAVVVSVCITVLGCFINWMLNK